MPAIQAIQNNWNEIENIGIEPQSLFQFAHSVGKFNKGNGLKAVDHKNNDKIFCYVNRFGDGGKFTGFTVGTNKHGGETFTFNNIKESKGTDYSNVIVKPIAPRVKSAAQIQKETNEVLRKENTLKQAHTAFNSATSANIAAHPYLVAKKVSIDGTGLDLRIVSGNRLQYAIHNIDGTVLGYQTIDATGGKKYTGSIGGGMAIIGGTIADCERGFIACEGLSTGLTAWHDKTLNAKRLPVVVTLDAGNMVKVVDAFVAKFDGIERKIKLLADNDTGNSKAGNTGVLAVLKICEKHGIKSYFLPFKDDGAKCDFNDSQQFKVVDVPAGTDLKLEQLKVVSDKSAQKLFDEIAKDVIFNTKATNKKCLIDAGYYSLKQCIDIINNALTMRDGLKFDVIKNVSIAIAKQFAYRSNYLVNDDDINDVLTSTIKEFDDAGIECDVTSVQKFLSWKVSNARETQRKLKIITDKSMIDDVMNVDGKTPVEVATDIEFESLYQSTLFVDNRGMNGFKTQTLVELAPALKGGIAYISPLVSVCKQAADRMKFCNYQDLSLNFVQSHSRKINAVFCINSIPKFDLDQHFTHGFIDELAAVYESIHDDTGTNKHQQKLVTDKLAAFLMQCETIVISDAAMNSAHVAWIKSLCGSKKVVLLHANAPKSTVNHYLLQNHAHSHGFILRDVAAGKRGVIGCDTVANALAVKKILSSVAAQIGAKIDVNRVLLATGENNGEFDVNDFIEQPNENAYRYDVVIHSPIIRSGTSINSTDYDFAYLLYDGVVSTSDAMQIWGRCRNAKDRYVSFGNQIDRTRITDSEMLFMAEVKNDVEMLNQKGKTITVEQYIAMSNTDLDKRRHAFTAQINADKNEFKNNFLFHCEITGRDITRIESEIENDKKLTIAVKEKRCSDRLNAEVVSPAEYKQLKSANKRWQSETDAMKRHEVVLMAYGNNAATDSEITLDDCMNEINGMLKPLLNFELLTADTSELKALDKIDKDNDCLKFSRVKLQKALNEFIEPLKTASRNFSKAPFKNKSLVAPLKDKKTGNNKVKKISCIGQIGRYQFNKACDKLEKHAGILALAGLGKFTKINRKRAGFTVGCLLEKIGYEMAQISQKHGGEKFYFFAVNDDVKKYAAQRMARDL